MVLHKHGSLGEEHSADFDREVLDLVAWIAFWAFCRMDLVIAYPGFEHWRRGGYL